MRLAADDLMHLIPRRHQLCLCPFVQSHVRFERQDPVKRVVETLLGDAAVQIPLLHAREILVHLIKEQEHVHAGRDRRREYIAALHAARQSYHVGRIRQHHAVKPKFFAEKPLDQLR